MAAETSSTEANHGRFGGWMWLIYTVFLGISVVCVALLLVPPVRAQIIDAYGRAFTEIFTVWSVLATVVWSLSLAIALRAKPSRIFVPFTVLGMWSLFLSGSVVNFIYVGFAETWMTSLVSLIAVCLSTHYFRNAARIKVTYGS